MTRLLAATLALPASLAVIACEKLPDVPDVPPVAAFIYTPVSPINAGQTVVTFNASGTRDPDGTVASYTWNFGDGTPEQTATAPVATHVFPVMGSCIQITYAVLLTATDDKGGRGAASQNVTVTELPAPGSPGCQGR